MSFAFLQSAASVDANALTVSLTGVTAGSLIVALAKWEGAASGTGIVSVNDGTNNFVLRPLRDNGTDMHVQAAYLLASTAGAKTYTFDINGTETFRSLQVLEFSYSGDCAFDVQAGATGTGTALASGNAALSGVGTGLQIGCGASYTNVTFSARQINATNAAGFADGWRYTSAWYAFNASGTMGATATVSVSNLWIAEILAFKDTPRATAPLGSFDPEMVPLAWFDPEMIAVGWFDKEFIDVAAAGGGAVGVPYYYRLFVTG